MSQHPAFPACCFEGKKVPYPASSFLPDRKLSWRKSHYYQHGGGDEVYRSRSVEVDRSVEVGRSLNDFRKQEWNRSWLFDGRAGTGVSFLIWSYFVYYWLLLLQIVFFTKHVTTNPSKVQYYLTGNLTILIQLGCCKVRLVSFMCEKICTISCSWWYVKNMLANKFSSHKKFR